MVSRVRLTGGEIRRLCIFPGHLRTTGAVRVMLNLAEELLGRGIEVDLFLSHQPGALAHMIPKGVRLTVGRGGNVRSLPALVRYLRHRRPDALMAAHHADNVVSVIATKLARVDTKVIVTIHNDRSTRPDSGRLRFRTLTGAMRVAYRRAHAVVAVSNGVADDAALALGMARDTIKVIYNPTITRRTLAAAARETEHPWLQSVDKPVVLGVGRLTAQKDFGTLLRAFDIVRRQVDARLLILGDGEDRATLEELVDELGIASLVSMPGTVPSAIPYMKRASVLASSSRWDGLAGVLIEALAVGTQVVATDCPSGPREILEDGRYGELVPVGDFEALAGAILRVLRGQPTAHPELEIRGRWFSADRAVTQYLEVLSS
jgi:glycosyltransferase involved in cell wall biosynthesis